MYVAGTGGHGDRGYRYEEVEQIDELKDSTVTDAIKFAKQKAKELYKKRYDRAADQFTDQAARIQSALDRKKQRLHTQADLNSMSGAKRKKARAEISREPIVTANEEVEQVEEGYKGRRAFGSAYDKTHDPFQDSKSRFRSRELEHELAHEAPSGPAHHDQTPHDVHIDGKKWKTFGSAGHAHNVANKLSISGKRASVHKTPIAEKAPPGWEGTVKAMKKHPEIDNPYALAWWMKRKGAKSHKGEK